MTYDADELREIRIQALVDCLPLVQDDKKAMLRLWAHLAGEIRARSPERVAAMERKRGLR